MAACGNGAWASVIRVAARVLASEVPSVHPGSGMSTTVGGRSHLSKVAASGRTASMVSRVSGRAARGSGYTIPGLCRPASLASLKGSVINCLEGDPEKGLVGVCWRAGEERPNPEKLSL